MLPNKAPIGIKDAIKEASKSVILPEGNGDSSDVSRWIAGLENPLEKGTS